MISSILNALLILILAPLLPGIINKTKSIMGGRKGPPVLQVYYDISKLIRKSTVLSTTTTWMFLAGPAVALATAAAAVLFLPIGKHTGILSFSGDMLLVIYLFALARFFVATAALDTGSSFEGMGASREVTYSALAEPALLLGLLALAKLSGSIRLNQILSIENSSGWEKASASIVLIIVSWFLVLLAENSRVPFDDPNTHLELTMIHEVMVLDHSGPALGFILYGASLKLMVFSILLASLIVPVRFGNQVFDTTATIGAVAALAIVIGLIESAMARLRLIRVPKLLITASLLAAFAVVLILRVKI